VREEEKESKYILSHDKPSRREGKR
jgi:hypothetical protein